MPSSRQKIKVMPPPKNTAWIIRQAAIQAFLECAKIPEKDLDPHIPLMVLGGKAERLCFVNSACLQMGMLGLPFILKGRSNRLMTLEEFISQAIKLYNESAESITRKYLTK